MKRSSSSLLELSKVFVCSSPQVVIGDGVSGLRRGAVLSQNALALVEVLAQAVAAPDVALVDVVAEHVTADAADPFGDGLRLHDFPEDVVELAGRANQNHSFSSVSFRRCGAFRRCLSLEY